MTGCTINLTWMGTGQWHRYGDKNWYGWEMDGNGWKWFKVPGRFTVKTSATDYLPRFFCHWKIIFTACGLQNDERKNADFKVQLTLTNYYPSLIKENMLHRWHSQIVSPTDFLQINQDPRALAAPQTPTGSNNCRTKEHQGSSHMHQSGHYYQAVAEQEPLVDGTSAARKAIPLILDVDAHVQQWPEHGKIWTKHQKLGESNIQESTPLYPFMILLIVTYCYH